MIVIDAFYADSIPFHLATHEFLQLVRTRLAPGGVVVVNVIGALDAATSSKLLRSLTKTYRSSFPTVLLYPVFTTAADDEPHLHRQRDPRRDRLRLRRRRRSCASAGGRSARPSPTAPDLDRGDRGPLGSPARASTTSRC